MDTGLEARYERLYSAAARMLTAQGPAASRAGWPEERRRRWSRVEMLLTALPATTWPGTADPAWQLASRLDDAGQPVSVADAVRHWRRRLRDGSGTVAVPARRHAVALGLLDELAARLAPGRPAVTVGAGDLSTVAGDLAAAYRSAAGGATGPRPSLRGPRPLSAGMPVDAALHRL
jgi:hypothetical protein